MKIKKIIYEIPGAMNISELEPAHLHSLKVFSLPIWVIAISIGLSFTAQPARAGTEDMHRYFRYVPYEGPKSTTGTDSQRPKQAPGANETEAKKAQTGEQAVGTDQKPEGANQAKEAAGTRSEDAKKIESGEQAKKSSEATGTVPMSKSEEVKKTEPSEQTAKPSESSGTGPTGSGQAPASGSQATTSSQNTQQPPLTKEGSTAGDQKSPVKKPERDTGEFPSGEIPSFSQVDINGDHYVTKDELKNFPELLRVFDKVDAGKDGRLEQHEFQNLEMETKREGEIP